MFTIIIFVSKWSWSREIDICQSCVSVDLMSAVCKVSWSGARDLVARGNAVHAGDERKSIWECWWCN